MLYIVTPPRVQDCNQTKTNFKLVSFGFHRQRLLTVLAMNSLQSDPHLNPTDVELDMNSFSNVVFFHPTDVELVWYFLKRKVMEEPFQAEIISEIDLYKFAPWDLPVKSCLQSKELELYFFCSQDRKHARKKRSTGTGYWKITGKERAIYHESRIVGFKKTLVFYIGRASRAERTDWVMDEFRLNDMELVNARFPHAEKTYVLCKIFKKSGLASKKGKQNGASCKEEDREDNIVPKSAMPSPFQPCSPRLLDSLGSSSGPVHRQSLVPALGELPPQQNFVDDNSFLAQMINGPDMLPVKACDKFSSMFLHENIDEFVDIHTQNAFEQNRLYQLEQMRTDIGGSLKYVPELEPISKKYFSDGPGVSMLPVNADDKSTSITLRENHGEAVGVHTQTVFEQKPFDQLERMSNDTEEVLKCIGELEQRSGPYFFDNTEKELAWQQPMLAESAVQQVPGFQSLGKTDPAVVHIDPAEVPMPFELLSYDPSVDYSNSQYEFPTFAAYNARDVAHGSSWSTGHNLLADWSFVIPETDGPSDMDHDPKTIVLPSNARASEDEVSDCGPAQHLCGGTANATDRGAEDWDAYVLESTF